MRLSTKQQQVIANLELTPDISVPVLARRLSCKQHTVRYALDSLIEAKILTLRPFVDIYRVVPLNVGVFLALAISNASRFRQLCQMLINDKRVSFLQTQAGEYHLYFAMHAERLREVLSLLDAVGGTSDAPIISRAIVPMIRYIQYRHKCIGKLVGPEPSLHAGETPTIVELTSDEKRLLNYLANHWSGSLRQVARDLSIPFSTFEGRLQRLKRLGVLTGAFYDVNASSIGLQSFRLLVYCRHVRRDLEKRLEQFCRRHRSVTDLTITVGPWDFEIGVTTLSPSAIPLIIGELHELFPAELLQISAVAAGETLKHSFFPGAVE